MLRFYIDELLLNLGAKNYHKVGEAYEFNIDSCNDCMFMHHNACYEECDTWYCRLGYVRETTDFTCIIPKECKLKHGRNYE